MPPPKEVGKRGATNRNAVPFSLHSTYNSDTLYGSAHRVATRIDTMAYYLNLFSPETYDAFTASNRTVAGLRLRWQQAASKIRVGDKLSRAG